MNKAHSKYNIGDIVYVTRYKYSDGTDGENHLFVIIDINKAVTLEYFGFLVSSKIYKYL